MATIWGGLELSFCTPGPRSMLLLQSLAFFEACSPLGEEILRGFQHRSAEYPRGTPDALGPAPSFSSTLAQTRPDLLCLYLCRLSNSMPAVHLYLGLVSVH